MPTSPELAIIVFARAPVPGRVKTRLAARIGAWRAAQLQRRLILQALRTALRARCGSVELHGTSRHAFFLHCQRRLGARFRLQHGGDLGERMHRALARALRRHRAVILIGADCPALRAHDLRRAARLLAGGCDVVLAPAEDGGYVLIGARRIAASIFADIAWGSADVYASTVKRLNAARYRWRALRTLWDLDRPQDLERLTARRSF